MKKTIAFLPTPGLMLFLFADDAESVPINKKERIQCPAKNFSDENECFYERHLIREPLRCMEEYGGGLKAVMAGGESYRTFEDCQAAVSAQ